MLILLTQARTRVDFVGKSTYCINYFFLIHLKSILIASLSILIMIYDYWGYVTLFPTTPSLCKLWMVSLSLFKIIKWKFSINCVKIIDYYVFEDIMILEIQILCHQTFYPC